ncbi:MAG TPA: condensation domain-containing protein, partial [Thermoanaerobaculia bacterium]|nr:condensation domain-containing protein [Thermoanaerobaculia bacterium]
MSKRNVESAYALSPLQEGILFHSLYEAERGVYLTQFGCVFAGQLDVEAFGLAWRRIVERHPILRTAFAWKNTRRPLQVVGREVRLPFVTEDWSDLPRREQERRWQDFLTADRKRGFDLARAPLMRLALVREAPDLHRFLWTHHHILLDGWSISRVFDEIFALYEAYRQKREIDLPPCPPFRDYIAWLGRQDLAPAEAFWRAELAGFTAPTPLWPGAARPVEAGPDGRSVQVQRLPEASVDALRTWVRRSQLTPNTLVQGAWALLLGRYSGEEDIVFGITVSGRPASLPGVESMVGLFINTMPLRVDVRPGQELLSWLRRLQERQLELRQYEFSPLVEIQGWSEVPRGLPLFESLLVFENYPVEHNPGRDGNGLEVREVLSLEQVNYPLSLESSPSLQLYVTYDPRRFEATAVTRLLGHLEMLLESFVALPEGRLEDVSLLTGPER